MYFLYLELTDGFHYTLNFLVSTHSTYDLALEKLLSIIDKDKFVDPHDKVEYNIYSYCITKINPDVEMNEYSGWCDSFEGNMFTYGEIVLDEQHKPKGE